MKMCFIIMLGLQLSPIIFSKDALFGVKYAENFTKILLPL